MKQDENQSKDELSLEDNPNTDLTEVIKDLIPDELPQDKKEQINQLLISQSYSDPLPPPVHLEGYGRMIDNGAERLMKMVENEAEQRLEERKHDMEIEAKIVNHTIIQKYIGQIMGFAIAIIVLGVSYSLVKQGHELPGAILGSAGLVGLVAVFVSSGRFKQNPTNNSQNPHSSNIPNPSPKTFK